MNTSLTKALAGLLRKTADRLDGGNSELSETEAMDIMSVLCHQVMSKADVCSYLNISRSSFDDYVRKGVFPKGKKRKGFKELVWYRDEIDKSWKNY